MNALYLIGAFIFLIVLSYSYFIFAVANKQRGVSKIIGQALSGLFVLLLLLSIISYATGVAQKPRFRFMSERPTARMQRGMVGYVTGMMVEDEKTIDQFINSLKATPELYSKFKEKMK